MNGLSNQEVIAQREKYGSNQINVKYNNAFLKLLLESLGDPIIKILLVALAIKLVFLIKDFDCYETIGILIAIFIASFISTISEYGSEQAFKKLQDKSTHAKVKVIREGMLTEIDIDDVVVGDILDVEAGDIIPADGIIIKGQLLIDESMLTGEFKEVNKKNNDQLFRGTMIMSNQALMKVSAVGINTEYGKVSDELTKSQPISPLKIRLTQLAQAISKMGYFAALLAAGAYLFAVIVVQNQFQLELILSYVSDYKVMLNLIIHALTIAVTIIIVAVPEGLPMMITLVLSSNMRRMLKDNVLVRKLNGIETAGNINILFTDKTGTLTEGKLSVINVLDGDVHTHGKHIKNLQYLHYLSLSMQINNGSRLINNEAIGSNATDRALMTFLKPNHYSVTIINQQPFSSENKYMITTIYDDNNKYHLIKGAPELLLQGCSSYLNKNGEKKAWFNRGKLEKKIQELNKKGVRILCLVINNNENANDFSHLTLVGIVSLKDQIRGDIKDTITLIKQAHITPIMITGDNINTAEYIARETGIIASDQDLLLTSDELKKYSDYQIAEILPNIKVVARALPLDKSRIIKIAQSQNLIVGMIGDGINDAPALKLSDVGFAMGSGTEVAKSAGDIVILDNKLKSIVKAVLYGRTIFKSIRKFIVFQLTLNVSAVLLSVIGPLIGVATPVTVVQMLWINMVMDTLAGIAFAFEPPMVTYLDEHPKQKSTPIINHYMKNQIMVNAIFMSSLLLSFLLNPFAKKIYPSNQLLMTAFFGIFIFMGIFNSLSTRTTRLNILIDLAKNKIFVLIIISVSIIQTYLIYYGGNIFRTTYLTIYQFLIMLVIASSILLVDTIRKIYFQKKNLSSFNL